MPTYTHDRFGECELAEITQKQLSDYSKIMLDIGNISVISYRGESVKAAIKCGFFIEPKMADKEVDEANPGYIRWLSDNCIAVMISEATSIDPLP